MKRFKQRVIALGLSVMMLASQVLGIGSIAQAAIIFEDSNIEKVVRAQLNKPTGEIDSLSNLTYLNAEVLSQTSLSVSDLSTASNLSVLSLRKNFLHQPSLLSLPTNLQELYMSDLLNPEIDLDNLRNLNKLKKLDLERNKVINLNKLTNLTSLQVLLLEGTQFTPWNTDLNELKQFNTIKFGNNSLSDISFLNHNRNYLKELYFGNNNISDISVLRNLNALTRVDLGNNPLNVTDEPSKIIQELQQKGVQVTANFAVVSPTNYFKTNINTIPIIGLGTPSSTININNTAITVKSDGTFNYNYSLQPGLNEINISSNVNPAVSYKRFVVYDDSIVLTAPQDGYRTNDIVKLAGKSKLVNSRLDITVNDSYATSLTTDISGNFSQDIHLATYGRPNTENIIKIKPSIVGSDVQAYTRRVYLDRNGPTLNAEVNATLTKQDNVTLSGSASDDKGTTTVTVSVNGSSGSSVSFVRGTNNFERTIKLTREGINTIKVVAKDDVGNQTEKNISVTYDKTAPKLLVTSPEGYSIQTNSMTYVISGTAEAGSTIKVNNNIEIPNVNGKFSKEIELRNGDNEIIVTATDAAGNVTTDFARKVHSFAPSIDEPTNLYPTKAKSVTIRGKGTPGIIIKINNVDYKVPSNGEISKVINLQPGVVNIITVEYYQQKITRRVISDIKAELSLTSPSLETIYTNQSSITLRGTTEKDATLDFRVNNQQKGSSTIDSSGNFSKDLDLTLGENLITVTATDFVGNISPTLQRKVIYDVTPPELSIISPTMGAKINTPRFIGKTEAGAVLKINNQIIPVSSDGSFDTTINMNQGENTVSLEAIDKAGNSNLISRKIIFDNSIKLSFIEPTKEYTSIDTIAVKGLTDEANNLVKVNGVPVTVNEDNQFSIDLKLLEGKNVIIISAQDEAGNLLEAAKTISLDTVQPIVNDILADPYSSSYSPKNLFKLTFVTRLNADDSPIQSYDLQYRNGENMQWQDLKNDYDKDNIILQAPKLGLTYYFRVRAKDKAGNTGEWTSKTSRVIIPYDDNTLIISKKGFNTRTNNKKLAHYQGTLTSSLKAGETLTYKFTGNHVALIGAKGKLGAKAKIYIDNKYITTIDTNSSTSKIRQVFYKTTWVKNGTHTLKIVNAGSKQKIRIDLDALAVGRS